MTKSENQLWQTEAEHLGGIALSQLVTDMLATQRRMLDKLDEMEAVYGQLSGRIDTALSGFPQGDTEGHRRYHQAVIEWQELRNKLVREALFKMVGAGAIAGAGWFFYALFQAIRASIVR